MLVWVASSDNLALALDPAFFSLKTSDHLVWIQGSGLPSEETNCPTTEEAPLLFSWKLTSETMISSSSTEPQLVHTASPRPASYSISAPPQLEHTVDFDMAGDVRQHVYYPCRCQIRQQESCAVSAFYLMTTTWPSLVPRPHFSRPPKSTSLGTRLRLIRFGIRFIPRLRVEPACRKKGVAAVAASSQIWWMFSYQIYYFPSFNLTFSVLGTCLIVRETLVLLFSTLPCMTGVPRCDRLQIFSETVSSVLWSIPCKYFSYISSFSTSRLLGSSSRERQNLDSKLVSSCCIGLEKSYKSVHDVITFKKKKNNKKQPPCACQWVHTRTGDNGEARHHLALE